MVPSKMLSPIWGMMTSTAMSFLFRRYDARDRDRVP